MASGVLQYRAFMVLRFLALKMVQLTGSTDKRDQVDRTNKRTNEQISDQEASDAINERTDEPKKELTDGRPT